MVILNDNVLSVIVERFAIFDKLEMFLFSKLNRLFSYFSVNKFPHNTAMLPSLDLSNKPADEVENINIRSTYYSRTHGTGKKFSFKCNASLVSRTVFQNNFPPDLDD